LPALTLMSSHGRLWRCTFTKLLGVPTQKIVPRYCFKYLPNYNETGSSCNLKKLVQPAITCYLRPLKYPTCACVSFWLKNRWRMNKLAMLRLYFQPVTHLLTSGDRNYSRKMHEVNVMEKPWSRILLEGEVSVRYCFLLNTDLQQPITYSIFTIDPFQEFEYSINLMLLLLTFFLFT
jgi:hypothetical protein